MNILVTGGAGFIGANLCRRLVNQSWVSRVSVIDNLSTGRVSNLEGLDIDFVEGSILDFETLNGLVAEADAVVHLAARPSVKRSVDDPKASFDANVTGALNVLEACRAKPTPPMIVFASSSSVYGSNPALPKSEGLATFPQSPYAATKLCGEAMVLGWSRVFSLPAIAFRFFNVFGPLQQAGHAYAAVVPAFVDGALRGRVITIDGDGTQTRDFTFVDTVTDVIATAVRERRHADTPVNLAMGSRTSVGELLKRLEVIVGTPIAAQYGPTRAGDVKDSQADSTVLRRLFPDVKPTSLDQGLRLTVDWMKGELDREQAPGGAQ